MVSALSSSPDREVSIRVLSKVIVLCSYAKHSDIDPLNPDAWVGTDELNAEGTPGGNPGGE